MKYAILIPESLEQALRRHLFQNELEQGAFLYSRITESTEELAMEIVDYYPVPPAAWEVQCEYYLEMSDAERAKIMKRARDGDFAVIECHSHQESRSKVFFSPSDCIGISEFAAYAKWKLDGKPYGAMVWGESSVDAVLWHGEFVEPSQVDEVRILGQETKVLIPRATWWDGKITPRTRKSLW